MNKQALAFLTMFSLVLMLSVYYVTLPSDTTSVMSEDTSKQDDEKTAAPSKENVEEEKQDDKKETTDDEVKNADDMQAKIDQKKDEEMNAGTKVVSQSDADEEQKKAALLSVDALQAEKELQHTLRDALLEVGYKSAVEIYDQTCMVNVFEQEDNAEIAQTIMMKASEIINQKYFIEVTFK